MFHNYFFLKRYAKALNQRLIGFRLLECFSQNKNELILGFSNEKSEVWIKANLQPQIGLLLITEDFKRAKKNSVDLFDTLLDQEVTAVSVFQYERSFAINFHHGHQLIFKMHASRSNILHAKEDQVIGIFRNQLPNDLKINPLELHQNPEITRERFESVDGKPTPFIPALGKEAKKFLSDKNYETHDVDRRWELMSETLQLLESNPIYISVVNHLPTLSLFKPDNALLETEDAILAGNELYLRYTKNWYLSHEKQNVIRLLDNRITKTKNYLIKSENKLKEVENRRSYEEIANIIMANLHTISKGTKSVELFDFYTNQNIEVKLNPELSPQKNAENLYRKSKNVAIEVQKIKQNLTARTEEYEKLIEERETVQSDEDIKSIKKKFISDKTEATEKPKTYHLFQFEGYEILIGKNAKSNDQLTLKVANKSDHWLHARDVPGSHVVIRERAGKNLPKNVLERAAELAAWFSKRKTDTLCPVIYTQKKFVRKAKGSPAGQVIVEKENVLMVKPNGF